MNVADLESSKKLFKLSGWEFDQVQGYSLSFLLRKLPTEYDYITFYRQNKNWGLNNNFDTGGFRIYKTKGVKIVHIEKKTPEDALCSLAIKLFEEKILTKEPKKKKE